jgi:leucine-rich repeat-containing protein 49
MNATWETRVPLVSDHRSHALGTVRPLVSMSSRGGSKGSGGSAGQNNRSFAGSVHRVTSEVLKIGEKGQLYGVNASANAVSSRWTPGSSLKPNRLTTSLGGRPTVGQLTGSGSVVRTVTPHVLASSTGTGMLDHLRRQHRPHSAVGHGGGSQSKYGLVSSMLKPGSKTGGGKRRPMSGSSSRPGSSLRRSFASGSGIRTTTPPVATFHAPPHPTQQGTKQVPMSWRLKQENAPAATASKLAPPVPLKKQSNGGGAQGTAGDQQHGARATGAAKTVVDASDACVFAIRTSTSGDQEQVVYRTPEQKAKNPERLNLDRRQLTVCPHLENETKLRLLNYQNNKLVEISSLYGLPNLIFLDLYNNQLAKISNLENIPTLRVLMLGKNNIQTIENLNHLRKLDVLDLHSNRISVLENMDHLADLRVLNLAGNNISCVENIRGLRSLTELNVRRNAIEECFELDILPALQRVFMSNNKVSQLESVSCLFRAKALAELALDGNPVCSMEKYRPHIVLRVRTLLHLDLKRVTEDERRKVSELFKAEEHMRAEERRADQAEKERKSAIRDIETNWRETLVAKKTPTTLSNGTPTFKKPTAPGKQPPGYSEVEVEGSVKRLCIYGLGFNVLSNSKIQNAVDEIKLLYVSYDTSAELFHKYRAFGQVHKVTFHHCALETFAQLDKLLALPKSITEIDVNHNPINELVLLRPYIAHKLPHIVAINGVEIEDSERHRASRIFSKAVQILEDEQRESLFATVRGDRYQQVSETYTNGIFAHAMRIEERLVKLNETWPAIVDKIVKDTVVGLDSVAMFASIQ